MDVDETPVEWLENEFDALWYLWGDIDVVTSYVGGGQPAEFVQHFYCTAWMSSDFLRSDRAHPYLPIGDVDVQGFQYGFEPRTHGRMISIRDDYEWWEDDPKEDTQAT